MNKTAEKIKKARTNAKMSEKALAKKVGLTESYIVQVEAGKKIINESIASKIFKVLKINEDTLSQEAMARKEEVVQRKKKVVVPKKVAHQQVDFTASWSSALDNLFRKYPIYHMKTQKVIDEKTVPVLDKKVEGYHCDKLTFVEVVEDLEAFNMKTGDVVMVYLSKDITNDKLYYFDLENKKQIGKLRKEQNKKVKIFDGSQSRQVDLDKVKVVGLCVKLERRI